MKKVRSLLKSVGISILFSVLILLILLLQGYASAISSNNDTEFGLKMAGKDRSEFLALAGGRQILAWIKYTDTTREYPNTLDALSKYFKDYTITESKTSDPAVLAAELEGKDVFLMPEPDKTDTVTLKSVGSAFSEVLNEFVNMGGVVIVLAECKGWQGFLSASGLLDEVVNNYYASHEDLTVLLQNHPLAQGLSSSTIKAEDSTSTYTISNPDAQIIVVGPDNKAAIACRQLGVGYVILIGYDYYDYNDDAARILANAVNISDILLSTNPSYHDFEDVLLDPSTPPQQTVTVANMSADSITIGDIVLKGKNTDQFGVINDSCSGKVLDASDSCTVDAFFNPTSLGEKTASLELPYVHEGNTLNAHVLLQGVGTLPSPPVELSICGTAGGTNRLDWEDAWPGVNSFKIYRKKGTNAWRLLAATGPDATSYMDTSALSHRTQDYFYYLRACEEDACSKRSDTVVVPAAPVNQPLTINGGKVDVAWTDVSGNETLYRIWRKESSCGDAAPWTMRYAEVGADVDTYTDANVVSGKTYAYRVRAIFKTAQKPYGVGRSVLGNCVDITLP